MEGDGSGQVAGTVELHVDGVTVQVAAGASLLDACDRAGAYVPRLCAYPGLPELLRRASGDGECGLCLVRLGDGALVLACAAAAAPGVEVSTTDRELRSLRLTRLAPILAGHPHICLTCPDRDGCARDACTFGVEPGARCCVEFGRCELAKVVAFVDPGGEIRRIAVAVSREAAVEGRIRREPGLCIACGRCVAACETLTEGGRALEMGPPARPTRGDLRGSGCTFCGRCVMVCPTGAFTAPGEKGARWLAGRFATCGLQPPVLPSDVSYLAVTPEAPGSVPAAAGVVRLTDERGRVLCIVGTPDLRQGLARVLGEPGCKSAAFFRIEVDARYTLRESELLAAFAQEHGHLPPGNDPCSDLLAEDLFADDSLAQAEGEEGT